MVSLGESQTPEAAAPFGGLEKPVVGGEYTLMPGDNILITISGGTNYSYITGVTYEGKITINLPVASIMTPQGSYEPRYDVVEAVLVHGLTLDDARDSLDRVFAKYFRRVNVDITLLGMRQFVVYVAGEVRVPGSVRANPVDRVSEIVGRAGGTTTTGSRTEIMLRRGQDTIYVDLERFEARGDISANPFVQDGDIVYVPKMSRSVIVKGAVFGKRGYELKVSQLTAAMERTSEGLYELKPGERLTDFVTKAGGLTPWADVHHAYVERGDDKIGIDLGMAIANPNSAVNIELQNGDVLVVPAINSVVYVQGQVVTPGAFPHQPNLRASDYLGLAGGPLTDANSGGAYLVRKGKKISLRNDPVIEAGDRIYVPRQIFKFWQDYVEIGALAVSILISYLTLRGTK